MDAFFKRLNFRLVFALCLLLFVGCSTQPEFSSGDSPLKSPTDKREYRYVELPNGLKVLLISDDRADKAAAALDVFAGSSDEPRDQPGLAHFLEHMLFLGTEKYPESGEYQTFLNQHGGSYNAFTSFRHTNYFFDVAPDQFEPVLDRFAQFFIAPLFNEEYVHREKMAVHSEYLARIKDENRRQIDALQQVLNQDNPASKFSVGSLDSLRDTERLTLQQSLLRFFRQYYVAENMTLVLLAREDLDSLETMVREKFNDVPNRPLNKVLPQEPLIVAGDLPTLIEIQPLKETRELSFLFPVPDEGKEYRHKSLDYIANLLGHEGQGSLMASLRECGWAENLYAGEWLEDGRHSSLNITIGLSQSGLENWQAVSAKLFEYIDLIREQGVDSWRYQEQGQLSKQAFQFYDPPAPMSAVSQLAIHLHEFPAEDVLRGPYLMDQFDAREIKSLLNLLNQNNVLVALVHDLEKQQHTSPYYEVPFNTRKLTGSDFKSSATDCQASLALPKPNPYIAENFSLLHVTGEQTDPVLLKLDDYPAAEVWYAPDFLFATPRAQLFTTIQLDNLQTLRDRALLSIYIAMINDNLAEQSYPAMLAGLDYSLSDHPDGIQLNVSGFSDKLPRLNEDVVAALLEADFDRKDYDRLKQTLIEAWRNTSRQEPYRQVWGRLPSILQPDIYQPLQLADELEKTSFEDLAKFSEQIVARPKGLRLLASGNISEQQVKTLATKLASQLQPGLITTDRRVLKLSGLSDYGIPMEHKDHALFRYYQAEDDSFYNMAAYLLLRQVVKAPFFDQLRTEQQLGYVVAVVDQTVDRVPGLGFLVQSPVIDYQQIRDTVDQFLKDFRSSLMQISEQDFKLYQAALTQQLLQKPHNLSEQSARFWGSIDLRYSDFATRKKVVAELNKLTLEDLINLYSSEILESTRRLDIVAPTGDSMSDNIVGNEYFQLPATR